jgi:hypothetical protein
MSTSIIVPSVLTSRSDHGRAFGFRLESFTHWYTSGGVVDPANASGGPERYYLTSVEDLVVELVVGGNNRWIRVICKQSK